MILIDDDIFMNELPIICLPVQHPKLRCILKIRVRVSNNLLRRTYPLFPPKGVNNYFTWSLNSSVIKRKTKENIKSRTR